MNSLEPEAFTSMLRIGVLAMAAVVSACAAGGKGPTNDGFVKGLINITTGEYARREEALQAEVRRLAERQAALENVKRTLTRKQQLLAARIDKTGQELAALQTKLSAFPRADSAPSDRIDKIEQEAEAISQEIDELEQLALIVLGA